MLTVAEKIAEGVRLKEEGNKLVQAKEFRKACKAYRRVFAYTNGLVSKNDQQMAQYTAAKDLVSTEDTKTLEELKFATFSNLALCYIKLGEFEKALDCSSKALQLDANNIKALLRYGTAATELNMWEPGKESLLKALKLDSENTAVKSELMVWKTKYKEYLEKQSQKEKELFGGKLLG